MKAKQNFTFHLDKDGNKVSNTVKGAKEINVKAGEEVSKKCSIDVIKTILIAHPSFLDLKKDSSGIIVLTPEDQKKYDFSGRPPPPAPIPEYKGKMVVPEEKYTLESLNKVYNKTGLKGLKEIGATFEPSITDRSSNKLIGEILNAQDKELVKG